MSVFHLFCYFFIVGSIPCLAVERLEPRETEFELTSCITSVERLVTALQTQHIARCTDKVPHTYHYDSLSCA